MKLTNFYMHTAGLSYIPVESAGRQFYQYTATNITLSLEQIFLRRSAPRLKEILDDLQRIIS